jgi:hypothetical protein
VIWTNTKACRISAGMLTLRRFRLPIALASSLLVLTTAGCVNLVQAQKDGERLDQRFHIVLSQGGFKEIYPQADPEFRQATSEAQANALFSAILTKLGRPVSSQQTSWRLNRTMAGTYLISVSRTEFAKQAEGTETFTWKQGSDGTYRLAGYNINSNELITR